MGSGMLGWQYGEQKFCFLPDSIGTDGSSPGDPADQTIKKPLIFEIIPSTKVQSHPSTKTYRQPNQTVLRTSNRELDGADHCQPSKYPDQGYLPQAGIQRSSEAQLTYRAAKEAGQWRHHACTSPIRQTEQLENKQTGVQQQSTKLRKQISTSDLKNPDQ